MPPTERLREAARAVVDRYCDAGHLIGTSEARINLIWHWRGAHVAKSDLTTEELDWLDLIELPCSSCGTPAYCASGAKYDGRMSRRCQTCDTAIRRANARRHSADYRQAHRQERQPQPCAHCGEEFTAKRSTATFCSTKCRVASHRAPAAIVEAPPAGAD